MATLYVCEQGARVEKEYRRIVVMKDDVALLAAPLARVSHVVLIGRVGVTTPALQALLRQGAGLSLLTRWGRLQGRLVPAEGKNMALRRSQYARAADANFCLEVARRVVQGKLRNARNLARRMVRSRPGQTVEAPIARIDRALARVEQAASLKELRGLEGEGARAYFRVFRSALEPHLAFGKRSRRPPTDPVNALLSLGYTLLTQNLMTACEIVGLDSYEGYFHADKYGRPALALDLVEEFRHVIVDSVVLNLVNRNMLHADDFEQGKGAGVYLSEDGLRVFLKQYAARLNTGVKHPLAGRRLTYQKIFEVQARQLRKVIEGRADAYRPFLTR